MNPVPDHRPPQPEGCPGSIPALGRGWIPGCFSRVSEIEETEGFARSKRSSGFRLFESRRFAIGMRRDDQGGHGLIRGNDQNKGDADMRLGFQDEFLDAISFYLLLHQEPVFGAKAGGGDAEDVG